MQVVRFTKYWRGLSIGEMGERAAMLGYDGLDLAVRRGHAINPDNVAGELAGAVKQWGSMGVACPMISTETEVVDAKAPMTRTLFEAAGAAGVSGLKDRLLPLQPGRRLRRGVRRGPPCPRGVRGVERPHRRAYPLSHPQRPADRLQLRRNAAAPGGPRPGPRWVLRRTSDIWRSTARTC